MAERKQKMAGNKAEEIMRRRDFLALAPACALSTGLFHLAPLALAQGGGSSFQEAELVSVGYWPGAPAGGEAESAVQAGLIAADSLEQGDLNFALAGARIDLHGLYPLEESRILGSCESFAVAVGFQPFHDLMFRPLTFDSQPAPSFSCVTDFGVPIDEDEGLQLAIEMTGRSGSPVRHSMQFSPGAEDGKAKLLQGVYFIAFRGESSGAFPDWADYEVAAVEEPNGGAAVRLRPMGAAGDMDVDFEYIVMSVGYGQPIQDGGGAEPGAAGEDGA